MTGIDWSKAPKGYDYHINWGDISTGVASGFYKDNGDCYIKVDGCVTLKESISEFPGLEVITRPTEPGALPPVGTVCEFHKSGSEWIEVEVIAHFRNSAAMVAAFIPTADGEKHVNQAVAECFRPIRTAEQIAAEEREQAIDDLSSSLRSVDGEAIRVIAAHLLAIGYRKQVQP